MASCHFQDEVAAKLIVCFRWNQANIPFYFGRFPHLCNKAVVDLKMTEFAPEFAGKMNFYLSAVDDLLRHPSDAPSLGLILCKTREKITVEYALRNTATPIGVAEFRITDALPVDLRNILPTVQQIEAELSQPSDG